MNERRRKNFSKGIRLSFHTKAGCGGEVRPKADLGPPGVATDVPPTDQSMRQAEERSDQRQTPVPAHSRE
jgi:hypothetical protein